MSNFLLNPQQLQAVQATEGPVLVLAGAGSGKTRALTYRIAYLITEKKVPAHQILAVTFTNKAADKMKERVRDLGGCKEVLPTMGTFHSVGARILRLDIHHLGYQNNFTILDDYDQSKALKHVFRELQISEKQFNPKVLKSLIEQAKNKLVSPEEFSEHFATDVVFSPINRVANQVYQRYEEYLKQINSLDFGNLLLKTVELWQKHPLVLRKYQNRWQYILVDEYQDVNYAQYEFCRLLAQNHRNLFVVGDDFQSIYGFRGAEVQYILDFEKDWKEKGHLGVTTIVLEQNYRSTEKILNLANVLIRENARQRQKVLWTEKQGGELPKLVEAEDEKEEAEFVIMEILNSKSEYRKNDQIPITNDQSNSRLQMSNVNLNDYVVLYRTNAQSRAIEEVLIDYDVPYRIIGGVRFYERKEIKDILAYLKLLNNPIDLVSLERVINVPARGIGEKTVRQVLEYLKGKKGVNENMLLLLAGQQKILPFISLLKEFLALLPQLKVSELIETVVKQTGYLDYLEKTEDNFKERLENLAELQTAAKRFDELVGSDGLTAFLESTSLVSDIDELDVNQSALTLMTIHSAKGLEFPYVFMVGMEQGLLPHYASLENPLDLEEERRLCYVGITRAKEKLYLTYTRERTLYGTTRYPKLSEFIAGLEDGVVERIGWTDTNS